MLLHKKSEMPRAFTVIELFVVVAVLAILGTLFLPVMVHAKGKSMSMSAQCLNNHKQLITAAIMYADENRDWWPLNMPGTNPSWCYGWLDFVATNSNNTNIALLTDPVQSVLGPFLPKPQILHCPADKSYVPGEGARVRSVSMSGAVGTSPFAICNQTPCAVNGQWLGGTDIGNGCQTVWRTYGRTSQMIAPTPSGLWVFCDEHPDSINDNTLMVQCVNSGISGVFVDLPANYHNEACSFSFADGHVELHKWTGKTTQDPVSNSGGNIHSVQATDQGSANDLLWIQSRTSAHY
jgi:prepilin-type processing-associated H-X9-DG protein